MKGPLPSCSCNEHYNSPGPLYNQVVTPYPDKHPRAQTFPSDFGTLQNIEVDSLPPCSCGCVHDSTNSLVSQTRQFPRTRVFPGVPQVSGFVNLQSAGLHESPPVMSSPIPKPPDPPTITNEIAPNSHIMKIPKKSESSSITITLNSPDSSLVSSSSSSISTSNSIYPPVSPPSAAFDFPSRPFFYTQPPQFLASCPATIPLFYPTTIPTFSVYPPFTCPAHHPSPAYPSVTPSPTRTTQPLPPLTPLPMTPAPPKPKDDNQTIASFTSTIPQTKIDNITSKTEKRDHLLTFKLLTAAASKAQDASTTPCPSPEAEAASTDCSMPIPPFAVS